MPTNLSDALATLREAKVATPWRSAPSMYGDGLQHMVHPLTNKVLAEIEERYDEDIEEVVLYVTIYAGGTPKSLGRFQCDWGSEDRDRGAQEAAENELVAMGYRFLDREGNLVG